MIVLVGRHRPTVCVDITM